MKLPNGTTQQKAVIWQDFSIPEFLMDYSTLFRNRPSRDAQSATLNIYVDDWPKISEGKRREAKWLCDQCRVNLSELPGSLHCHHKNGVVTDNSAENLRVLCALCHALQPGHQHMKVSSSERNRINRLRINKGLSAGSNPCTSATWSFVGQGYTGGNPTMPSHGNERSAHPRSVYQCTGPDCWPSACRTNLYP